MKWRVLNMMDISHCPEALDLLKEIAEVVTLPADPKELLLNIPEYDGYFASLHVRVTEEVIHAAAKLRAIATPSTGTDHIDIDYAENKGVSIISLKHETEFLESITSTAEMAWALLLAVIRKLPWSFDAAKRGEWARDRFRGYQLAGKTLGILGYGRLGRMMAQYGKAFRMRVIAHDICDVTIEKEVKMVDFDTLLRESDILTIHIHLTDENRGLFNAAVFSQMKKGAVLINTSRGAILDEQAFLEALESGHLGGAGVDVIHGEWDINLSDHPLIRYADSHENLVITPHTGGVTYEAQSLAVQFTAQKLAAYLESSG